MERTSLPLWVLPVVDGLVVFASYVGALMLRFEGAVPNRYWEQALTFVLFVALGYVVINYVFGLYSARVSLGRAAIAGLIGGSLAFTANVLLSGPVPRSVAMLGAIGSWIGFMVIRLIVQPHHRETGTQPEV